MRGGGGGGRNVIKFFQVNMADHQQVTEGRELRLSHWLIYILSERRITEV